MYMIRTLLATLCIPLITLSLPVHAFESGALEIWINNDKSYQGLQAVGDRFTRDTGIPVVVRTQDDWDSEDDPAARFTKFAATSEGPDVIFWAHDRFGSWINEGYLEPVEPPAAVREAIHDFAWSAVTVGDRLYGYPVAMEAISLIYNPELVANPPKTWGDVIALDRTLRERGKRAIVWDYTTPYFTWPLVTSAGGYSFRKIDQVYQLTDVGVDNRGAVQGMSTLNQLMEAGVIEADDDYGRMMDSFLAGDTAMIINGPWAWNQIAAAGIDFELARFPAVSESAGHGRPFVGFLSAAINGYSPNTEMARKFLEEYVVVYEGVKTLNDDRPLGAAANKQLMAELEANPRIAHTFAMAATGETMPDIPEMRRFWSSWEAHLQEMAMGEIPVQATLERIGERLRKLDDMKMWSRKHYLAN